MGEAGAAKVDVAMGDASMLVVSLVALKAAKEPMVAKETKAAVSHSPLPEDSSPSFPGFAFCRDTTELDWLEKQEVDVNPMAATREDPGARDDHCEARDLVRAEACRVTQRVVKAQAAIFLVISETLVLLATAARLWDQLTSKEQRCAR